MPFGCHHTSQFFFLRVGGGEANSAGISLRRFRSRTRTEVSSRDRCARSTFCCFSVKPTLFLRLALHSSTYCCATVLGPNSPCSREFKSWVSTERHINFPKKAWKHQRNSFWPCHCPDGGLLLPDQSPYTLISTCTIPWLPCLLHWMTGCHPWIPEAKCSPALYPGGLSFSMPCWVSDVPPYCTAPSPQATPGPHFGWLLIIVEVLFLAWRVWPKKSFPPEKAKKHPKSPKFPFSTYQKWVINLFEKELNISHFLSFFFCTGLHFMEKYLTLPKKFPR